MEAELAPLDPGGDLGDQRAPLALAPADIGAEGDDLRPAARLGLIHRPVGRAEQPVDARLVLGVEREPDRGAHVEPVGAELERAAHHLEDRLRGIERGIARVRPLEEQREFIAREARDMGLRGDQPAQPQRQAPQQLVARAMAEPVVDRLEPVEVDEHERQPPLLDARPAPRRLPRRKPRLEPRDQPGAVGHARQAVDPG